MGDRRERAGGVQFDGKIRLEFHGANVVRHVKYVTFQMTEVGVRPELFARILKRIHWFGVPPPMLGVR